MSDYTEVEMIDLCAAASEGREHHGVCRTLIVPVVDMQRAHTFRLCTVWLKGGGDDHEIELTSGSETGSPWLGLWLTLPDGTRVKEGINVVDLVQAWVDVIVQEHEQDEPNKKGNDDGSTTE
jgi:hypothetical protein